MTEGRPQQLTSRIARHAAFFRQGGVAIVVVAAALAVPRPQPVDAQQGAI